jgi:hypothetical protein
MKKAFCFLTNDVETTSLLHHELRDETGKIVLEQGMPRLLDLYDKYNVKTTFFYTSYIAKLYPEVVRMAHERGHEVASHGYSHLVKNAFDVLSDDKINEHLYKSKDILQQLIGEEVISFRAPALRIRKDFAKYLLQNGYKIDSSVASQRIDMFMSFGAKHKLNWLYANRSIYFTSEKNIFKKGESDLLEIPVTSILIPYIGTLMRISPLMFKSLRPFILLEKTLFNRHVNLLTHPNEFIDEIIDSNVKIQRRSKNPISYLLGDVIRHKLKIKNLGEKALPIYENELKFLIRNNFEFTTMKNIYELKKQEHAL